MAIPSKYVLFDDNNQYVEFEGLYDGVASTPTSKVWVNNATGTVTLYDEHDTPVAGLSGISMVYVTGSNGNYRGAVGSAFTPPVGGGYTLVIAMNANGTIMTTKTPTVVEPRTK